MKFDKFDSLMRQYEESLDQKLPPNIWPLVRLDGRNFGTLVESHHLERPYDHRFYEAMLETAKHLMQCGFQGIYAYVESDEISVLFDRSSNMFERQFRKWISILAGEASAAFTHKFQDIGVFDARICPISDVETLVDYFRWRQESSQRTALQQIGYWLLRKDGHDAIQTTQILSRLDYEQKLELLRHHGVSYKFYPMQYRLGCGLRWNIIEKIGVNPKTNQTRKTKRRILEVLPKLTIGDEYSAFVKDIILKKV